MSVSTASDLLVALEASNLLRPDQIAALKQSHAAVGREVSPTEAARALVKRGLLTKWQAEKLLGGHTAFFLGKYRLLERIGRGGMGSVYKARHEVMGRVVALKVMARSLVNDADAVARFQREVRAAAALSHPNIVTAHDADCAGDVHFLVMEFVDGRDLHWWIKQGGPLPIPWSCECIRQAALGLEYARSRGLVHRDIKPSNLLVYQPDEQTPPLVKILDLGLARLASEKHEPGSITRSGQIMGTPDYIAPEQAEDVHAADTRADIFSLGCTLFQMLTGQLPYGGATLMAKLLARTQRDAPPVQNLRPDVPPGLSAVVARMLARRPEDRYQTPAEVAEALAPFARDQDAQGPGSSVLSFPAQQAEAGGTSDVRAGEDEAELNEFLHMLGRGDTHREQATVRAHPDGPGSKPPSGSRRRMRVRLEVIVSSGAALALVVLGLVLGQLYGRSEQHAGSAARTGKLAQTQASKTGNGPQQHSGKAPDDGTQVTGPQDATRPDNGGTDQTSAATADTHASATDAGETDPMGGTPAASPSGETPAQSSGGSSTTSGSEGPSATPDSSPVETPAEAVGRTLLVGVGRNDYPDLNKALADARPGDVIRIRHRGPLFLDPTDLTGKTPLTIEGDALDGVDYWPLLFQTYYNNPEDAPHGEGLFHAQQLELTLRKLHLVAGGSGRSTIDAIIRIGSGAIRLEQCTVHMLVGDPAKITEVVPVPLVGATGEGACVVHLDRVFASGWALGSVVAAVGEGNGSLHVEAVQCGWAAGGAPWVSVEQVSGPVQMKLERCTVYNAEGLVRYRGRLAFGSEPGVSIEARRNLFVGAYASQVPFVDWRPQVGEPAFEQALRDGQARYEGHGNVYHRFVTYYPATGRRTPGTWTDWQRLIGASSQASDGVPELELDPFLSVYPMGLALEECEPRDFEPRWERQRGDARRLKDIGADATALPPALPALHVRAGRTQPELAHRPRGRPRVLVVDRTQGPYKTLEDAFEAAQDDDIVEIADNGPYVPKCNFQNRGGLAVLQATVSVLTVRARRGVQPTVVLHPGALRGKLPDKVEGTLGVALFGGQCNLILDGLHIVVLGGGETAVPVARALGLGDVHTLRAYGDDVRCAAIVGTNASLRCTNCTLTNAGAQPLVHQEVIACIFASSHPTRCWFENCVMHCLPPSAAPMIGVPRANGVPRITLANCVLAGGLGIHTYTLDSPCVVYLWGNTFFGSTMTSGTALHVHAADNLVVAPDTPFSLKFETLAKCTVTGSNNGLWVATGPLSPADRAAGFNALLPGPVMAQPPQFLTAGSRGSWPQFRLARRKQAYSTLAADGGSVGARVEYLPEMPTWLQLKP